MRRVCERPEGRPSAHAAFRLVRPQKHINDEAFGPMPVQLEDTVRQWMSLIMERAEYVGTARVHQDGGLERKGIEAHGCPRPMAGLTVEIGRQRTNLGEGGLVKEEMKRKKEHSRKAENVTQSSASRFRTS